MALHSGDTPGQLQGKIWNAGIKSWLAVCMSPIHCTSLQPHSNSFLILFDMAVQAVGVGKVCFGFICDSMSLNIVVMKLIYCDEYNFIVIVT